MLHVCYAVLSVTCSLLLTYWERLTSWFSCVLCFLVCLVTFPYSVPGHVWYLIVLIPDLSLPLYFVIIRLIRSFLFDRSYS